MILEAIRPETSNELANYRPRLLVVDDHPVNIQVIHSVFASQYEVFMALSGEQALAFCHRTPPDLILLDVVMPEMDGLEVCRRLRQDAVTRDIPVIFVTGKDRPEEENACWEAGAVDFVTKPPNPVTLQHRVRAHLTLKFQADRLRELAFIDGLTGVANRRIFDERLEQEWRRCGRSGSSLAVILADVDFFKRFNDSYGHQAGDDCLKQVAACLKRALRRPYDLVARYGGEEFVCLLPETDLEGAVRIATGLEQSVRDLGIVHAASDAAEVVTISVGVSAALPGEHPSQDDLLRDADSQLYRSKQEGRARVSAGGT